MLIFFFFFFYKFFNKPSINPCSNLSIENLFKTWFLAQVRILIISSSFISNISYKLSAYSSTVLAKKPVLLPFSSGTTISNNGPADLLDKIIKPEA